MVEIFFKIPKKRTSKTCLDVKSGLVPFSFIL